MAGGKESPRQKMIGMMYLVLTALLALNVSKEILNSFIVVNQGLENTNQSFAKRIDNLYASFDFQKGLDPVRVTPYWSKAQEAKKQTAELYTYIDQLKKRLVMETEDIEKNVADTLKLANVSAKDNYDITTHLMIGESEDGSKGVARELKEKLNTYKTKMLGLLDKDVQSTLLLPINTEGPANGAAGETWERYNFDHTPLAAAVTILSKLQSDVRNSESEVITHLLSAIDSETLKFDTITAKVIPQSNYVLVGEEYKADVFIAAFSKTQKPTILTGDYDMDKKQFNGKADSIPVEKGQGKYSMVASREGFIKWGGTITMKSPKGKVLTYPFTTEFIAARPSLTVSADNMNVMYMGVVNPISVSVPGVPNERLKVSISTGSLKGIGNGKYEVTGVSGGMATVNVTASMENGESKNMGQITFRVKQLPTPYPKFGNLKQSGKMALTELKVQQGLAAKYDDNFEFKVGCNITQFTLLASIRNQLVEVGEAKNGYFTSEMKKTIAMMKKNDKLIFTNIKAVGPDNIPRTLSDLTITAN